jgi:transposase, IS5 family
VIRMRREQRTFGDGLIEDARFQLAVLTRLMKKITKIAGDVGTTLRDRTRSVKLETLNIALAARSKAKQSQTKLKQSYRKLLDSTSRVVGQAKKFANDVAEGIKQAVTPRQQLALDGS